MTEKEVLILASLVEKEAKNDVDRQKVASIIFKRYRKDWPLQIDATIQYALGYQANDKTWWKKYLTTSDLGTESPYNTYTNIGLPPTPIAMVGREAIHAALHPADGTSLYFVAKGDGSHTFSDDLDAHNSAVREFQIKRRADYRSSPAPAPAAEPQTSPVEPQGPTDTD